MKTILALVITGFVAGTSGSEVPSDTTGAFQFDPDKVETGKTYFYLKSNIDGSRPSNVASRWGRRR